MSNGQIDELLNQPAKTGMKVPYRDLAVDDPQKLNRLLEAVRQVLVSGRLMMGAETIALEARIAKYCGRKYCVGVGSGTDALYMALRAFDIGPGAEVITTPMSWVATVNSIAMAGADPVFVDVRDDYNIDPDQIEAAITPKTRAIIPVHFNGLLCEMTQIQQIASAHGLTIIEDAAQAFGAFRDGTPAGSFGDAAAFSLNPMKILAGYGEAGAVVTNDEEVANRLQAMRYLGTTEKEVCRFPALNAKIDEIQAALLSVSFDYLRDNIECRVTLAKCYTEGLAGILPCPLLPTDTSHVFFDYKILVEDRSTVMRFLAEKGVETKVKHPILMPDQPAYESLAKTELPVARHLVERMLSLPLHEKMVVSDVDYVIEAVRGAVGG